jgi:hypothetical protein
MSFVLCNAAPLLQNYDADLRQSQPTQFLPDTIAYKFKEVDWIAILASNRTYGGAFLLSW